MHAIPSARSHLGDGAAPGPSEGPEGRAERAASTLRLLEAEGEERAEFLPLFLDLPKDTQAAIVPFVPRCGSWADMLALYEHSLASDLKRMVVQCFAHQLRTDAGHFLDGREPVSEAARFAPRERGSFDRRFGLAGALAASLFGEERKRKLYRRLRSVLMDRAVVAQQGGRATSAPRDARDEAIARIWAIEEGYVWVDCELPGASKWPPAFLEELLTGPRCDSSGHAPLGHGSERRRRASTIGAG